MTKTKQDTTNKFSYSRCERIIARLLKLRVNDVLTAKQKQRVV